MQIWLFGTFLAIFVITSALTILAVFTDIGNLSEEYKDLLSKSTVVEVAACIIALFVGIFGLRTKPVAQPELDNFCRRVKGYWLSTGADPDSIGFASFTHDRKAGTLILRGRAYDLNGIKIAVWETTASCIYLTRKKLNYTWQGRWTQRPTETIEGFGEITFHDAKDRFDKADGVFYDSNLTDIKSTTKKASDYRRCTAEEVEIFSSGGSEKIGALVRDLLYPA